MVVHTSNMIFVGGRHRAACGYEEYLSGAEDVLDEET